MKKLPTLYRLDSKNKIREWSITMYFADKVPYFVVNHGLLNGQHQSQMTYFNEGKNKGKKNETTPEEQCMKEAEALWLKQIDKGYREKMDNMEDAKKYLPMLAYTYEDYASKVTWPALIQPKLDGTRCIAIIENGNVTLLSRKGKLIKTMSHIEKELSTFPNCVLDGELYNHDMKFDKIIGAIKRDEQNENSELIEYHVYDLISYDGNTDLSFIERYAALKACLFCPEMYPTIKDIKYIKLVNTYAESSEEQALERRDEFIKNGYEGAMYRSTNGFYKINGRSKDLLKMKKWQDAEFEIVNGCADKLGECVFECVTKNGYQFSTKMKGTHDERVQQLIDIDFYIGKYLTVEYFELSKDGIPRFPCGLRIREDI